MKQIAFTIALAAALLTAASAQTGAQGKISPPSGKPQRPSGLPALKTPFTINDVASFFKNHNLPKNNTATSAFTVASLEFITAADVSKRLPGVSTGLDAWEKVGFATLTGTFQFSGPPGGKASGMSQKAYALFDVATGNLLMVGTAP